MIRKVKKKRVIEYEIIQYRKMEYKGGLRPHGIVYIYSHVMKKGLQYRILIDPLLRKAHRLSAAFVPEGGKVIDIACGNGSLAMYYSSRAESVTGIDLSREMINYAKERSEKLGIRNTNFIEMDATDLSRFDDNSFDIASISMAIHQFSTETGFAILHEMKRIAKEIIIIDYQCPLPGGFKGFVTRVIERIAGEEHNKNFNAYLRIGGLPEVCNKVDLVILNPIINLSVFSVIKSSTHC